jgi:Arc/MetJ-type ribon-helix-helix transcriptional regulator
MFPCVFLSLPLDARSFRWYVFSMPISLPPDLDARVQQKLAEGSYHTPDEVLRKALDALDAQEQPKVLSPRKGRNKPAVPVWQRFQTAARSLPEEELALLPPDGASEHDHYLYNLPKRSA